MNEDYLWDKTGQPDPQIQQLEEILGTLRYQPRPLELPRDVPAPRRRNYLPLLVIAATVLMALLAGAVWLRVRTRDQARPQQAKVIATPPAIEESKASPEAVVPKTTVTSPVKPPESSVSVNTKRRSRSPLPGLGKREREEALAVKQQLMLALRLASEKLNMAHRKTQSTSPANQIKNQHRVG